MKDQKIIFDGPEAKAFFTPDRDGERFIAFTEGGSLIGALIEVEKLSIEHAAAIDEGHPGAVGDVFSPIAELGYYRVIAGTAFLAKIDGRPADQRHQLASDNIFETSPE